LEDNPAGDHPVRNIEQVEGATLKGCERSSTVRQIVALAGEEISVKKGWTEEVVWNVLP
jgi:hypothetical protein